MMLFEFSCMFSLISGLFFFGIFLFYLDTSRVIFGAENSKIFVKILSHFLALFSHNAKCFSAHFLFQSPAQFTHIFSHKSLLIFSHIFSFYFLSQFLFPMSSITQFLTHVFSLLSHAKQGCTLLFSLLIFSLNLCSISHSFSRTFLY